MCSAGQLSFLCSWVGGGGARTSPVLIQPSLALVGAAGCCIAGEGAGRSKRSDTGVEMGGGGENVSLVARLTSPARPGQSGRRPTPGSLRSSGRRLGAAAERFRGGDCGPGFHGLRMSDAFTQIWLNAGQGVRRSVPRDLYLHVQSGAISTRKILPGGPTKQGKCDMAAGVGGGGWVAPSPGWAGSKEKKHRASEADVREPGHPPVEKIPSQIALPTLICAGN